jgi:acyl transferase domain-containing protein
LEFNSEFFFNYPTASKIHTAIAAKANHQTDAVSNIDHESQSSSRTFANPPLADAIESASANSQFQIDSPTQIQSTTAINGNGIPSQEPIAIIGMACRFPGHVNNPTDYWSLLCSGRSGVVTVPTERWDADRLHHPDPDTPGKMWTRQGGFLHGIDQFDAPFFGISRREARKLDPQQRLLLETAWHTFEDAGLQPARIAGSKTGVFVGIGFNDYAGYVFSDHNSIDAYCATGTFQSTASGRLSYFYDLCGPCMSVDTACSSSITALHLAVNSLRQGESEMALVAGANFISPEVSINFTKARMLSPDGVCRTFDKSANGYVRGEGCGAVLLKRLTDAERDGDIIHAVIRATACNQDGRSNGLTAPNGLAQQTLLREMLATAQVPPESIAYAEAHGTATPLGDPLEANALITALRRESTAPNTPLLVGSVKTNLGHLEAAAGMASLIKVVLTLGNHKIPPHLNFEDWNPEILRSDVDVQVPLAVTEFPPFSTPARATVSSFGFGGTNAMALVEEYPATSRFSPIASDEMTTDDRAPHESESTPQILCLSAKSSSSLKRSIQAWLNFLPNTPAPLGDLALATQISRQHFQYRRAIVASSIEAAIDALMEIQIDDDTATELPNSQIGPQIAFLFTGQGSQYWNMGRALYRSQPSFRASFQECSDGFERLLPESLHDVLFSNDSSDRRIHDTLYTQPALFALEVSLARMWLGFGVQPSVCLGHSIGEFAAALTAGVLDLPDAIAIVAERARLMNSLPRLGGMTACFAEEKTVVASLQSYAGRLAIAAANSPNNTVVSGESESLSQFENDMRNRGVTCQRLTVSHAFHSPLMQPIAKEFAAFCSKFTFHKAKIPFVSNVTGKLFDDGHRFDADYLVRQLLGTVRFADCVKTASEFGTRIFLELGPDATLSSLGKRTVSGSKTEWYPSLKPKQKLEPLQQSLAGLYEKGVNIDWTKVHQGRPRPRVSIPLYEFDRQSYWYTNDQPTLTGNPTTAKQTPCLPNGSTAIDIQSTPDGDLHWRMELRGSSDADGLVKSLIEHRIRERSLFPAAGYVAISMLAAEHLLPSVKQHIDTHRVDLERGYRWRLMECKLLKPLALDSQRPVTLHCSMRRINQEEPAASSVRWQLATYFRHTDAPQGSWNQSFSGCLELKISNTLPLEGASAARGGLHQDQLAGIDDFQADDTIQIGADFYAGLRESGYHYGEPYQLVDRIALRDGTSRYDLKQLPSPDEFEKSLASRLGRTTVWLDCLAHGTLAIRPDSDIDSLWLPVGWDQFEWYVMDEGTPSDRSDGLWSCQAETESEEGDSYRCGLQAVSPSKVSLRWSGLSFQRIRKEIAEKKTDLVDTSSSQTALGCVDNGKGLDEINVLMDELKPVLADVLMLDNQEDVSTEKDFSELGMDSIMAAEFEIELSCRAGEKAIASSEFTSLRNLRQVAERLHHNGLRSLSKEGA